MAEKKTLKLGLRLSASDLALLQSAGERLWPGLPVGNATLVLTLAKMQAEDVLKGKTKGRKL